jgi:hypothetical protein
LRKFRALLFQLDKDGPRGKSWGDRRDEAVLASAVGFASYVAMVDPDRGKPLLAQARTIAQKYGWAPKPRVLRRAGGGSGGRGGAGGSSTSTPREGTLPDAARLEGTPLRSTRTPSDQSVTPQGSPASAPAPSAPTPPEEPPPSAPKKKWWKIF